MNPGSDVRLWARTAVAGLAVGFATFGCEATASQYERWGRVGVAATLGGGALEVVGSQVIIERHEIPGQVVASVGATLTLAGLITVLYAVDGLMRRDSERLLGGELLER